MKSKSCNFYHTNTKNPGDNPGIFFDPYNTADFEWLRFSLHNSYLLTSERTKWLYISVSAAMTMQNVVNPTFGERKSEYRTDVLPVGPCSRNGYE